MTDSQIVKFEHFYKIFKERNILFKCLYCTTTRKFVPKLRLQREILFLYLEVSDFFADETWDSKQKHITQHDNTGLGKNVNRFDIHQNLAHSIRHT